MISFRRNLHLEATMKGKGSIYSAWQRAQSQGDPSVPGPSTSQRTRLSKNPTIAQKTGLRRLGQLVEQMSEKQSKFSAKIQKITAKKIGQKQTNNARPLQLKRSAQPDSLKIKTKFRPELN